MNPRSSSLPAVILGGAIFFGLTSLGYFVSQTAVEMKQFERSITVKGLAEREVMADIVIWPIQFVAAGNDLQALYQSIDADTERLRTFLTDQGIAASDISITSPSITDKSAQQYGNNNGVTFRYTATQTVTVYSNAVETVRPVMSKLSELGKEGIVFTGDSYQAQTEYLFTGLNDIKPSMIEEATRNAREVATKFAADSESKLGKIKRASQGQFSIRERDRNNPHIKMVRVVSTIDYYLSD